MENSYGIGVTNRYAFFIGDDEDIGDPSEVLQQVQNEKKAKKVAAAAAAKTAQAKPVAVKKRSQERR